MNPWIGADQLLEDEKTWGQGYVKFEMVLDTKEKTWGKKGCLVKK